jgi:ketosteroid isomerase-like protein
MNTTSGLKLTVTIFCALTIALGLTSKSNGFVSLPGDDDEAAVRSALLTSTSSFESNNLEQAAKVWANDEAMTVFEQGHANYGWKDYRDNHLGPEMAEMKNTKYALSDIRIHLAGTTAWATFKYTIAADVLDNGKTRHIDGGGLGTAILEKRADGWRIVHWHSSAPRRAPAAPPKNP